MNNIAYLKDRSVLKISGDDAKVFLQWILSNDVNCISDETLLYAFLLTPQGRYCTDTFLFKKGEAFFLDIANANLEEIIMKLKGYRLRSKIVIEETNLFPHYSEDQGFDDPRDARLGKRSYLKDKQVDEELIKQYHAKRINLLIPDGSMDFIYNRSLVLNYNADRYHGVSFKKGCYIGQEVTARMHYRDVARKDIYKIEFANTPAFASEIKCDGKKLGIVLGGIENLGLALLNKETAAGVVTAVANDIEIKIVDNA